jgi:UDP-3-O-[3-hydroxymyristoyl] glucosamine N-acyltransferase
LPSGSDGDAELTAVSSIEAAGGASVVFATDAKTLARAIASSAGLILAAQRLMGETAGDARVIAVPDARFAFAKVAERLRVRDSATEIHATAVVAGSVQIGPGTKIAAGCVLGEHVTLGRGCEIGPNVTIYADTVLGDRVHVQAGAVLGSKGFGYVRDAATGAYTLFPQQGSLVIEDDVDIGANTTIDRGALGETRIGAGSKLDNLVHIGHNCADGHLRFERGGGRRDPRRTGRHRRTCDGGPGSDPRRWGGRAQRQEDARRGRGLLGKAGPTAERVSPRPGKAQETVNPHSGCR